MAERDPSQEPEAEQHVEEHTKLVEKDLRELADQETGVDVDRKMLAGRRADRGFTVATKSRHEDADARVVRHERRANTLPALNAKRGDWTLSEESQEQIIALTQAMISRRRRGSLNAMATVPDDVLAETWRDSATCHVHGIHTDGQTHGDEREWWYSEGKQMPGGLPPIISCQKGSKGYRDFSPNQDNFSITYFNTGHTLACTFDGHGTHGHYVSLRTVQTVPFFFITSEKFPTDIQGAIVEAFQKAQQDVVLTALEQGWDVQASGTTAVCAVWKDDKVWVGNCGDSKCIIGSTVNRTLLFQTEDHKPEHKEERARIEKAGGEVRTQVYPDGWVNHRIFVRGQEYPGLCMSRTLGDCSVKDHGVIETPETYEVTLDVQADEPFIILASDGIWEFLDAAFVAKAVAKKIKTDGAERTVSKLQREAKKRWRQEEGDYCDDITSVLIRLTE